MKRLLIVFIAFLMTALFCTTGAPDNNVVVSNRDDAIKYYKEKFNAINPRAKKIKQFDFSGSTALTNGDLVYLKYFPDLTSILIGGEKITDEALHNFYDKEELSFIDLTGTKITGEGFKYLVNLKKLKFIILDNTPFTDTGLKYISELKFEAPVKISLTKTKITDEGLRYLSNIKLKTDLYLVSTDITDNGLKYLANQKELKKIALENTKVTKKGAEWLMKQLPETEITYGKLEK